MRALVGKMKAKAPFFFFFKLRCIYVCIRTFEQGRDGTGGCLKGRPVRGAARAASLRPI